MSSDPPFVSLVLFVVKNKLEQDGNPEFIPARSEIHRSLDFSGRAA